MGLHKLGPWDTAHLGLKSVSIFPPVCFAAFRVSLNCSLRLLSLRQNHILTCSTLKSVSPAMYSSGRAIPALALQYSRSRIASCLGSFEWRFFFGLSAAVVLVSLGRSPLALAFRSLFRSVLMTFPADAASVVFFASPNSRSLSRGSLEPIRPKSEHSDSDASCSRI